MRTKRCENIVRGRSGVRDAAHCGTVGGRKTRRRRHVHAPHWFKVLDEWLLPPLPRYKVDHEGAPYIGTIKSKEDDQAPLVNPQFCNGGEGRVKKRRLQRPSTFLSIYCLSAYKLCRGVATLTGQGEQLGRPLGCVRRQKSLLQAPTKTWWLRKHRLV